MNPDITTEQLQTLEHQCIKTLKDKTDMNKAKQTAFRQLARAAARLRSELVMDELDQTLDATKPKPTAPAAPSAPTPVNFG